jgi:4-diphosphocytidyl-2-C-methyl-D-erythritol kinase
VPTIPLDERNIAYKTAKAFLEAAGTDCGVSIGIRKSIPSEAGMGGGSADGAAVLVGLNMLCGNPLVVSDLEQIAAKLGADIPFCIEGGTKRLLGIGTERAEQYTTRHLHLVIAKPQGGISTPEAYRLLDTIYGDFADHKPMSPEVLIDYICGKPGGCSGVLFNRFESVLDQLCPASKDLIDYMRDHSYGSLLCGSGAAVFAVADSPNSAKALADKGAAILIEEKDLSAKSLFDEITKLLNNRALLLDMEKKAGEKGLKKAAETLYKELMALIRA